MSSIPSIVTKLLRKRGISDAETFLNPNYDDISDPFTMHGMDAAVTRIIAAMDNGEHIAIYADYDADGIPGATILSDFFAQLGHSNVHVYIPHRHHEGYGLHHDAITKLHGSGVTVLITIDLGITGVAEVAYARSLGMDVIVTDHHEYGDELPNAILVHPKLGTYNDPMICGCAVAFQLIRAVTARLRDLKDPRIAALPDGFEKWYLDMVGLSTLADMVPLHNENRILAHYGLRVMKKSRRPGFQELATSGRVVLSDIDEEQLLFRMVPRINAASRMAHPRLAYELLSAPDVITARRIAQELGDHNDARRKLVEGMMKNAHSMAQAQSDQSILWVGQEDWHIGVLSIIAGTISETYNKPAFIWCGHGDEYLKGSVRNARGIDILEIMNNAPEGCFAKKGGHTAAGGFTLHRNRIEDFVAYLGGAPVPPVTLSAGPGDTPHYDLVLPLSEVTEKLIHDLDMLRPYGQGNPRPVFYFTNVILGERKAFGKTMNHEKLFICDDTGKTKQLLLFSSERPAFADWSIGQPRSLCAYVEVSGTGRYRELVLRPVK